MFVQHTDEGTLFFSKTFSPKNFWTSKDSCFVILILFQSEVNKCSFVNFLGNEYDFEDSTVGF